MFRNVFSGCVSDRSSQAEVLRSQKLKFGASLSSALKHGYLPGPLVDILVHIAKEGVTTADVFRRPGNPNDTRRIVKRLTEGKQVIYANYSFYTLASVVKKFLLKIPGGIFSPEGEEALLRVLTLTQKMDQIEAVHSFIEKLSPAHQQLISLLFGTWFRIVTYQEKNCMSVEALSRSVAGSMFHTCAEDPAKVEKASRIMQFLIDNFGVERMFGQENLRFFAETTHTGIHIRELYRYSYRPDSQLIPRKQAVRVFDAYIEKEASKYGFDLVQNATAPDLIEVTKMNEEDDENEDCGLGKERELSESPPTSPTALRHSDMSRDTDDQDDSHIMLNVSTLSAPEVSLVPSPEVSKRPKSLEDNLNDVRTHYQSRCLSRFNSVKRKQLERLRQRSDWFLSPTVRERNNSRKGRCESSLVSSTISSSSQHHGGNGNGGGHNTTHSNGSKVLQQKNSGNSVVTKASSEGAVLEGFSDGDSVFTDNTSRSESPASEPVWSHILKVHSRDIIHSDTIAELGAPGMSLYGGSGADLSLDSHDNVSSHYAGMSLGSQLDEEEEDRMRGYEEGDDEPDDDEDNNTPTGVQEEEDTTLMTSSLPDLQQQCGGDDSSSQSKDSPLDPFEIANDSRLQRFGSLRGSFKTQLQAIDHQATAGADLTNGQQKQHNPLEDKAHIDSVRDPTGHGEQQQEAEFVQCFLVERTYGGKTLDS
ncbi:dentin sialophosphoprotein isoform X1 [Biomphalaria pfeifferi]|uniref:Dentin sialophosphoprotein isoform X1 n=1 Tax=Biomphalaria pfeifferi TaxID=112525 RepID=A0AAD8FB74_BIOPF|nr:dentin sialophosphoprotein isoform X1 [Biomphalaria pfeifferi]